MLVVKIELHPFGDETKAKQIGGNLIIYNDGRGTHEYGSYGVVLLPEGTPVSQGRDMIRGRTSPVYLAQGVVKDYKRNSPYVYDLVEEALKGLDYNVLPHKE